MGNKFLSMPYQDTPASLKGKTVRGTNGSERVQLEVRHIPSKKGMRVDVFDCRLVLTLEALGMQRLADIGWLGQATLPALPTNVG